MTTVQTVQVAGGTLFSVAAQYLGDASQWNRVAALNGLTDPWLTGLTTLKIPPVNPSAANGGILGQ